MHKVNAGYTLLVPLKEDCVEAAAAVLADLHEHQERLPFAKSPTTHFATITIIPAQMYRDEVLPATLLFATSFCGPTRVHVAELVSVMGDGLREVFQYCEGFDSDCSIEEIEAFILEHRHGDTFYSGMQHLSPEDVRRHRQLRDVLEAYIDEQQALGGMRGSALDTRSEIQEYVKSRADLAWTREPFEPTRGALFAFHWRSWLVGAALLAIVLCGLGWLVSGDSMLGWIALVGIGAVIAFAVFAGVMFVEIHLAEREQDYTSKQPSDERARTLAATQLRPVINEFTLGGPIKKEGTLRPIFVRMMLWVVARVTEGVPWLRWKGLHKGINIPTVATARWIASDGGRRVLFISNYTNDGEPYVRDFIETPAGAMRINLSFGFGHGFPKCRWIVLDGALIDPNAYLYSLAENTLPTLFWYGPHRDISIDNIKVNRRIREDLFTDLDEKKAQEWLHLL